MSAVMPQDHRVARIVLPALVVLAVAATVATWLNVRRTHRETERRIADLAQAQQRLERAVHLFRLERGSKGLGVTAPLEQLRHWAPLLQLSTTPQHQLPAIQERADDILLALEDHGADAFGPLRAEFDRLEPGNQDELARWLLTAMVRVDRARGLDLLAACARGIAPRVSARIRLFAAEELVHQDRPRAAALLTEIVRTETANGVDVNQLPEDLRAQLGNNPLPPMPMFFNFIDLLVAAAGNAAEDTLLTAASRPDQDRMTVQACVKQLGDMKSERASKVLRRLYANPPEMIINPIFQNHCLDAIAKIEGAGACDWFREQMTRKLDERVLAKLQDLVKTHCP